MSLRISAAASLSGMLCEESQSLLLIPNWDSWVNQTHCRGLLWFPSWEVFRRSSSEDASCQTSFGLLSSLFSKFCPCGEAAGFSQQTKLDISIPCARFWSAWSCFPAVALSTVFYSLCTVPLETFSPPRLREALLFLQAKTPNTPPAGCFWVIPGDVSVEGKMKFFSFCRGTIVKVSLSKHLTVCGGDRLAEHCSKRWRGLKTEIVIFCWCTLFYTALLSCPLNAEVL